MFPPLTLLELLLLINWGSVTLAWSVKGKDANRVQVWGRHVTSPLFWPHYVTRHLLTIVFATCSREWKKMCIVGPRYWHPQPVISVAMRFLCLFLPMTSRSCGVTGSLLSDSCVTWGHTECKTQSRGSLCLPFLDTAHHISLSQLPYRLS